MSQLQNKSESTILSPSMPPISDPPPPPPVTGPEKGGGLNNEKQYVGGKFLFCFRVGLPYHFNPHWLNNGETNKETLWD